MVESATKLECDICNKCCDDPVEYGDLLRKSNLQVHYYCLLLSSNLPQNGKDAAGILGFLINDIKKEINAARLRICVYCNENHASIECTICKVYFHLKCGLENNCLFVFINKYQSYCHNHHNIKHATTHTPDTECFICKEQMKEYNPLTSIAPKCCIKNVWVHRRCLKIYALSAGYYLKCLWCLSPSFRDDVRSYGVFVPDRDASWERVQNAYAGFYRESIQKCMSKKCLCPTANNYKNKKWYIVVCVFCNVFAIHELCRGNKKQGEFVCNFCEEINLKKTNQKARLETGNTKFDYSVFMVKSLDNDLLSLPYNQLSVQSDLFNVSDFSNNEEEINTEELHRLPQRNEKVKSIAAEIQNISKSDNADDNVYDGVLVYNEYNSEVPSNVVVGFSSLDNLKNNEVNTTAYTVPESSEIFDEIVRQEIEEYLKQKAIIQENAIDLSDSEKELSASELLDQIQKEKNVPMPKPKKTTK